tara:strand:- start:1783 stop:2388 length:606 start_codon:yes stop_codon:yes gene_type:complete
MPSKCPPGVICVENITLLIVFIIISLVLLFMYKLPHFSQVNKTFISQNNPRRDGLFPSPSFSFSNIPNDVLLNPYQPPLKDQRIFRTDSNDPRGVPINVSTRAVDAEYRQVGILTRMNSPEMILPLMGRPLYVSRDKWNFYTMKDSNNMVKLPITHKNKSCTNEYGCDNLYNGDTVYVEGYNDTFKVTIYDNQVMQYIPYL